MRRGGFVINSSTRSSHSHRNKDFRWKPVYTFAVGALGGGSLYYYFSHLDTVPISNRRRFVNLPRRMEMALGEQQFLQIEQSEARYIKRGKLEKQVTDILKLLSQRSDIEDFQQMDWKVLIIDKPIANAFVLPGGFCVVYTGILPICKNFNGLATVLSHEAAHVLARHAAERLSLQGTVFVPLYLLLMALQLPFGEEMFRYGFNVFFSLPNSRKHESEADLIGVHLMARACLDPHESIPFWSRFEEAMKSQNAPPEFLSTHPTSSRRREDLIREMENVDREREKYCGMRQ